jgi:hypothetical protein
MRAIFISYRESVSYADLQRLTLSAQPIDGSEGPEN